MLSTARYERVARRPSCGRMRRRTSGNSRDSIASKTPCWRPRRTLADSRRSPIGSLDLSRQGPCLRVPRLPVLAVATAKSVARSSVWGRVLGAAMATFSGVWLWERLCVEQCLAAACGARPRDLANPCGLLRSGGACAGSKCPGKRRRDAAGLAPPVRPEKFFRSLGEHPSDFATLAFHAGDFHRVVGRRLVPHPCDDGRFAPAALFLAYASVERSAASSERTCAIVAAGAQTPREKTLRPTFSCISQCSPAALTRRVRAASPGGSNSQPCGTGSICPVWVRTVLRAGPGRKVWAGMVADSNRLMQTGPAPPPRTRRVARPFGRAVFRTATFSRGSAL